MLKYPIGGQKGLHESACEGSAYESSEWVRAQCSKSSSTARRVNSRAGVTRQRRGAERMRGNDSRLCGGGREVGLASELEGNLLDGGGLCEVKDYITAKEGGMDVDAGPAETEDVGVGMDLEVGVFVQLLLVRHVLAFARVW